MAQQVTAYEISLTAESDDGQQNVDFSGAIETGYSAADLQHIANKLQDLVNGGSLRMTIGALGFVTGQALLDWLRASNQPFVFAKVKQ